MTSRQQAAQSPAAIDELRFPAWPSSDLVSPWAPLSPLHMIAPLVRQMDALMSSRALAPVVSVARTAVDVRETPDAFEFVADVPGLTREEVAIEVSDENVLTISGERRLVMEEEPPAGEAPKGGEAAAKEKAGPVAAAKPSVHHRVERSYGRFVRSFKLPRNADADKVSATVASGVLTVRVPKKEVPPEQAGRGRINIDWKDL